MKHTLIAAHVTTVQFLLTLILFVALGAIIGVSTVHAETLTNLYVAPYGYVMTASTTGGYNQSFGTYGTGKTSTKVAVYYQSAESRIWHQESAGVYVIADSNKKYCSGCGSATTRQVASLVYDAFVSTQSFARGNGTSGSTVYTSSPDRSQSCSRYWSSGHLC